MKAESLVVQSFRGINDEIALDLEDFTILYGENGMGKSSFVNSLEYLFVQKLEFLSIIKKYQYELKLTIIYTTTNFDDIIFCDKLLIINNKQIVCENIENVCKSNYVKESNINIPLFYELNDKLKLYGLTSDNVTTIEEMVDELCN